MKITIITLFPEMIGGFFNQSIIKRAQEKGLVEVDLVNLRDFALDSYGTVDGRSYGGGAGMVLRVEPIYKAISQISNSQFLISKKRRKKIILTSPRGKIFNQQKAIEYSKLNNLIIIAGHYEGVDERVRSFIDEEISMGDFILTGGEIVAAAIVDSIVRLLPGALKKDEATKRESFFEVSVEQLIDIIGEDEVLKKIRERGKKKVLLLEYPQYTRPQEFMEKKIPKILLSGNHEKIRKWRIEKAYEETIKKKRFDLLDE